MPPEFGGKWGPGRIRSNIFFNVTYFLNVNFLNFEFIFNVRISRKYEFDLR